MLIDRREFIKISTMLAGYIAISTSLSGCSGGGSSSSGIKVEFIHGVASGDPLQDRVIIWTRITPLEEIVPSKFIDVEYEVATDRNFENILRRGIAKTSSDVDYTVKVDLQDLEPNSTYYYRFLVGERYSPTGKTKTLPSEGIDKVKIALFSCSNYTAGYFNAFEVASNIEDIDVVLHVGDYIYEYGMYEDDDFEKKVPAYATESAKEIGRELPQDNNRECITLQDYRKRYALHRLDRGTQLLHQKIPMIAIWDDHEIANDAYKNGAQNHQQNEGAYQKRVEAAIRAYYEWLPIRPPKRVDAYRSFHFGDLLSLNILETRLTSRDKQLDYGNYFTQDGGFDKEAFTRDWLNPNRQLMGEEQLGWLQDEFSKNEAVWQVLGQQVIMAKTWIPAELLALTQQISLAHGEQKEQLKALLNTKLQELVEIKLKDLQGVQLTQQERARIDTTLPYNLDAWDGYPVEREKIFGLAKRLNKRLVVLSGDSHNSWTNYLRDQERDMVGVEFATTSVTSPGFEEYLGFQSEEEAQGFEQAISVLVDDVKYLNAYERGFILLEFTPELLTATYYYLQDTSFPNSLLKEARMKQFQLFSSEPTKLRALS